MIAYLTGYVVSRLIKRIQCQECHNSLVDNGTPIKLIQLKNFSEHRLTTLSQGVIEVIKVVESYFCNNKEALILNSVNVAEVQENVSRSFSTRTCFPSCHNLTPNIVQKFCKVRMEVLVKTEASKRFYIAGSSKCASKSMETLAAVSTIK